MRSESRNLSIYRKWALLGMIIATSMIFLDSTILPVALPTMRLDLSMTQNAQQWVVNVYYLMMASLVFAGGKFADFFGRRRVFCLGMALYAFSSALASLGRSSEWVIAFRGVQGIGAALMGPASMALLPEVYPIGQRGKAIGILVSVSSIFLSVGPFLGGIFTQYLSWRYIFLSYVPLAIAGIGAILYAMPPSEKRSVSFDLSSFLSLFLGLGSFTFALMQFKRENWNGYFFFLLLFLSAVFFIFLYVSLCFSCEPFIDLSLFKNKTFFWGNVLIFCTQFVLMIQIFWMIYLQTLLHFSPLKTGVVMLSSTLPVLIFAPLSGYISDRIGPKIPTQIGYALILCSFVCFCFINPKVFPLVTIIPALFAYGCGISLVMTPLGSTTLSCFSTERNGEVAGIYNTIRYTGATLGIAFFSGVMATVGYYRFKHLLSLESPFQVSPQKVWKAVEGVCYATSPYFSLTMEHKEWLLEILKDSLQFAFTMGNILGAVMALLCFAIIGLKFSYEKSLNNS